MMPKLILFFLLFFFSFIKSAESQVVIESPFDFNSTLKVGVKNNGVFQLTGNQLASYGWTLPIPSNQISALGPQKNFPQFNNHDFTQLPFQPISLKIEDGGDGLIHDSDRILWYAHAFGGFQWVGQKTHFFHNGYDTLQYYYFQQTPAQQSIQTVSVQPTAINPIQSVYISQRWEKDSFNLLNSGRDWWGEFFPRLSSTANTRTFDFPISHTNQEHIYIRTRTASRSFGGENIFNIFYGQNSYQFSAAAVNNTAYDLYAQVNEESFSFQSNSQVNQLQLSVQSAGVNGQAWIDYIEWEAPVSPQNLQVGQSFYINRNGVPGLYKIHFPQWKSNWAVWNISDLTNPIAYDLDEQNVVIQTSKTELFYLYQTDFVSPPTTIEKLNTEDLYKKINANYFIITSKEFFSEAERIVQFHEARNQTVQLIDIQDIYIHFGNHVSAIRDFIGYQHQLSNGSLNYVLLIGTGSADPLNKLGNSVNIIPSFQTKNSLDPLATYTSDDYFVNLKPNADFDIGNQLGLALSIGRLPVKTNIELKQYIDKFYEYHSAKSKGPWKQKIVFAADDGDDYLHFEDAESVAQKIPQEVPYLVQKLYLDAFNSESQNGIKTYPAAVRENVNHLNNGVAIWNYNGHGSFSKLADENLIDLPIVQNLNNRYRLPLIITATCNFAPFDQMQSATLSDGLLFQPNTGAIGILSTTRLVFASSNRRMNEAFMESLFDTLIPFNERTVGASLVRAKNQLYASGDINNNAKFVLLGDPALQVLVDTKSSITDSIAYENKSVDTLKSTNTYFLNGMIDDISEGSAHILVLSKPITQFTKGASAKPFLQYQGRVFQGSTNFQQGRFDFKMVIPADLQYEINQARILYYINNTERDYIGKDFTKWIGGKGNGQSDELGPDIKLYLNDEKFVSGGITNTSPLLIAKLRDSTGINLLGTGLGHDILLTINEDADKVYTLNSYFESENQDNRSGVVRYKLPVMEPGFHRLKLRAWDVYNQWSEKTLEFQVMEQGDLVVKNVLNYPNPFTTNTQFWFEHNRPGEALRVNISIFTVTGKLVKTLHQTIITAGTRSDEMGWNGRDEFGNRLGRGVYIYKISVKSQDKQEFIKFEKLFIL